MMPYTPIYTYIILYQFFFMVKRCHNRKNPRAFSRLNVICLQHLHEVISTMFQAAWEKLPGDSATHNKNIHKVIVEIRSNSYDSYVYSCRIQ